MAHRALAILRRRLFNFLTILSLLLCLATVMLWVRSYWREDSLSYSYDSTEDEKYSAVESVSGELTLYSFRAVYAVGSFPFQPTHGWYSQSYHATTARTVRQTVELYARGRWPFRFAGFGYFSIGGESLDHSLRGICVPNWFPALLFAILPALRLRSIRRTRRRHRAGLCPHCGYDLHATPDRCPECGAIQSSPRAAPSAESHPQNANSPDASPATASHPKHLP